MVLNNKRLVLAIISRLTLLILYIFYFREVLVEQVTVTAVGESSVVVIGEPLQMRASVLPEDTTNVAVAWSIVGGTGAATIDADGLLTATEPGIIKVKATARDRSGIQGIKEIEVDLQPMGEQTVFVAHRGLNSVAPENTIPAFEWAGEEGFWGAEGDAQLSADGEWFILHNQTLDDMTNGMGDVTYYSAEELKAFTVDAGTNIELYPDLEIPTLEEFLSVCKDWGMVPYIDLKEGITDESWETLISSIRKYGFEDTCVITSFELTTLQEIRSRSAKISLFYLAHASEENISAVKELGNSGLFMSSKYKDDIDSLHEQGLPVTIGGIDNHKIAKLLAEDGADYISTNTTVWAP